MTATAAPGRELLACPFCGGPAIFERPGNTRQSCTIKCEDCGCKLETGEVFHQGTAWNTRLAAKPASSSAQLSELDAASNACLELCSRHGFATGHGDTVADIVREIDVQIGERLAAKPADEVDFSFDLRETLKAVLEFFGVDGAAKVTRHVMMARRSRDSNAEIDRLEEIFSTTGEPKQ